MDAGYETRPTLKAVFEGARSFGLTDVEVWEVLDWCLDDAGGDATVSEYLDEVTATLARCILARERRGVARPQDPEVAPEPGRRRAP